MNFSLQKQGQFPPGREKGKGQREKVKFTFFTFPPFPFPLDHNPQGFPLSLARSILIGLLVLSPTTALAGGARAVYSQDAQGINSAGVELKVWRGYGVTINFIPTGEVIKQVWIGDSSRISLTSNGSLCQKNSNSSNNDSTENCGNEGATVIFIRQIKPINFPNMTSSNDGTTLLTIITLGSEGQKQYQFKLTPAIGQPAYTSLVIKPDSERPLPVARTKPSVVPTLPATTSNKTSAIPPTPTPPTTPTPVAQQRPTAVTPFVSTRISVLSRTASPRNNANAVAYGLAIAVRQGQVKPGSRDWNKAQDAIKLLSSYLAPGNRDVKSTTTCKRYYVLKRK